MASSFGGTIKLTGADEYKNALKQINQNLRETSSSLINIASKYDSTDNSQETLNKKSQELNDTLEQQKKTLDIATSAYNSFSVKVQEQAAKHNALLQKYDEEKQKLNEIKSKYSESSTEYKKQEAVVLDLAKQVQKSTNNYTDNEVALSKLKTQMNNTQTAVNKTTKEISELGKETDESGKKAEKAGEGFTVFKGILANLGTQAINGVMDGLKSLGSAFANIGKQAIEGFADFEQLEGGVKKLFGDEMAETVKKNANDAFLSAGMTANEYMETITGFSASMINSLGGDTKKATELSDMAIRDMSDNANTFGTDMASIQNAYQGFAKGNYTMLDNLKLGFAGSKEGMQSLLDKASEISGQKFDISSFADITEAIHIMQEEMNIAGTTANEASMTISGSISSMKGAWSNLITGLADESANLSQLINNMIESIFGKDGEGGVLNNILPRIEVVIDNIVALLPTIIEKIVEFMPQLLETGMSILQKIMDGITTLIPQLMPVVIDIINNLVNFVTQNLPTILQSGITILVELVKGIAESLPTLIPTMIDALLLMVETLIDNIDLIIDAGIQLIMGLADGLLIALPDLIEKIPVLIEKLVDAIVDNLPKLIEMGIELVVKLAVGLVQAIPKLIEKLPQIFKAIGDGLKNMDWGQIGKDVLNGIISGLTSVGTALWNGIKKLGNNLMNGIKSFFGIHSPSTLFRDEIGKNLALGIGEGFGDTMSDVSKDMANSIPTEFDTNINANMNSNLSALSNDNLLIESFKVALSQMKIVLDDEVAGKFVENTMERVIYS